MKVRMFTVLAMIFFYRLLKKSDLILIEMKEIILKIKDTAFSDTAFSDTPYLAGQFIGAVLLFAIYILVLISILSMIIEILKYFEEV